MTVFIFLSSKKSQTGEPFDDLVQAIMHNESWDVFSWCAPKEPTCGLNLGQDTIRAWFSKGRDRCWTPEPYDEVL